MNRPSIERPVVISKGGRRFSDGKRQDSIVVEDRAGGVGGDRHRRMVPGESRAVELGGIGLPEPAQSRSSSCLFVPESWSAMSVTATIGLPSARIRASAIA